MHIGLGHLSLDSDSDREIPTDGNEVYPLTRGLGFLDLHRRPILIIFFTYDMENN